MGFFTTFILCLFLSFNSYAAAMENNNEHYELDPVVVTDSRIPHNLSNAAQSVSIISKEEINSMPATSIVELLEFVNGVDVRQRAGSGVQADVGIRGSSYEQTLILVDGIPMTDPQTGHHNMDIPVNLNDIERIEVLKGPAAAMYGPNAMGGVINIITKDMDQDVFAGYLTVGENGFYNIGTQGALITEKISSRLSASRRYSTGYIKNKDTDFDIKTLNYKGALIRGANRFDLGMGYTDKDFGAYKFYSDTFPEQREKTKSFLLYGKADLDIMDMDISPKIHWRHHDDKFKININNMWYLNKHHSDTLGAGVDTWITSGLGDTSIGCQAAIEKLKSSNLGNHDRGQQALFFEHKFYFSDTITIGVGASGVHYSKWGLKLWPGTDINIELTDALNWFASMEKSFRVPTFTELYYTTPANRGNPDLIPEKAWTYETGMRWCTKSTQADLSLFYRNLQDAIDWLRASGTTAWTVQNISNIHTTGVEIGFSFLPQSLLKIKYLSLLKLSYTYLNIERNTQGMESKYALDNIGRQVQGTAIIDWPGRLKHAVNVRYVKRVAGDGYTVVDSRITFTLHKYKLFLEATNLFDEKYIDAGFAPMPGRWVMGGVTFSWNF